MAKYEIVPAQRGHIDQLVAWGEKFWEMTRYSQVDKRPYNADSVRQLLDNLVENFETESFVLAVVDAETRTQVHGFGIVAVYPLIWDFDIKCAGELAYYLDPELRGTGVAKRLLFSMESVAKHRGVNYMAMISMEHSMDVGPIYEKMGYTKTETTYTKEL